MPENKPRPHEYEVTYTVGNAVEKTSIWADTAEIIHSGVVFYRKMAWGKKEVVGFFRGVLSFSITEDPEYGSI